LTPFYIFTIDKKMIEDTSAQYQTRVSQMITAPDGSARPTNPVWLYPRSI